MFEKLKGFLGISSEPRKNGDPREVAALRSFYHLELRLAEQIKTHAEGAPYPHVAQRLSEVAQEKAKSCEHLQIILQKLGSRADAEQQLQIKGGRNHWERLSKDVQDQAEVERKLRELTFFVDQVPEITSVLNDMLASEVLNRNILVDLLMRADPQAHQL